MVCHIYHAADSIDRSPDIMAHSPEKLCFCLIGCFCLFCCYQKLCFIFFIFFLFLFPVCQIGSVCPEPEYTKHQKIKKNNVYHTWWKVMEHFRIRKIRIDIIIPLLKHDSVTSDSFIPQMVNVLTICMLFHCLNNCVVSRILPQ